MNELKEEYISKINETLNSIEDVRILIYLDTFIKEMIKAKQ